MQTPAPPCSEADIVGAAVRVFGSTEAAQLWMASPAIGLDRQRPADLLGTDEGRQTLVDFLGRLESNVYT